MALNDAKINTLKPKKRRAITAQGKHWNDQQKIEAVQLWLTLGNVPLTAATLRIPEETLRYWRKCEWWKEVEGELKVQDTLQFSASAKKVIDKSMEAVLDRLHNGDWIYDQKTGELRRKPVAMRDALNAATTMIDKKILLDKQTGREPVSDASVEDKLDKLMDRFAAFAAGKPSIEVTDVIIVDNNESSEDGDEGEDDALYEGRQA